MADIDYDFIDRGAGVSAHGAEDHPQPARVSHLMNWAGAVVSLGLVVGMGVWAWQLTVRDVSGVPVIEALEGPMRVAPSDPGGAQAPHQGLAVNRIAEGAEAAPVPEQVILAPPPVDLDGLTLQSASTPEVTTPVTSEQINTETQAIIERLLSRGDPLDTPVEREVAAVPVSAPAPAPEIEIAANSEVIPASVPGVARSLRPMTRPAALLSRAPAIAATTAPAQDIDPATLAAGTRLVQLGAFDTVDLARQHWSALEARFPEFFTGRGRVIQAANSGGSQFYRLRAHGFENLDASRRFCTALVAQNAACIPVTVRE